MEDRFTHQGRGLADWLQQLVGDASDQRRAASRVIVDRFYMPESLLLEPGAETETIVAPFRAAVRDVVRAPAFPAADFVVGLFTLSLALEQARMDAWRAQDAQDSVWHDEQLARLGAKPTAAELGRYIRRACLRIRKDCKAWKDNPDEAFETGITIAWVIECLGAELLPAAPLIRHMLTETHQASIASAAICRMGAAAAEFRDDLLCGLQRNDPNGHFARPLGHLMRHVPSLVTEILGKLADPDFETRRNAITALGHCGREALRAFPQVENQLLEHLGHCREEEWFAGVVALGELAVGREAVSAMLAATSLPDIERVGAAISCLGRIGLAPELVVPRLGELLETFEDYDSDWCERASHGRIVDALGAFGAAASPTIPALIQRAWTKPQRYYDPSFELRERPEPDEGVISLLGSFGTAARSALPALHGVRAELIRRGAEDDANADPEGVASSEDDLCPLYLTEAIDRIAVEPLSQRDRP